MKLFFLFLVLFTCAVLPLTAYSDLNEFFKLKEKLPLAICDESIIHKAPSLETLDQNSDFSKNTSELSLIYEMSEPSLIRFLLDEPTVIIASPYVRKKITMSSNEPSSGEILIIKNKTSIEICTSLAKTTELKKLLTASPSRFLLTSPFSLKKPTENKTLFKLIDINNRFTKINQTHWIPGWVELSEIASASTESHIYKKISQPITHQTRFILVTNKEELPLGFLYTTQDPQSSQNNELNSEKLAEIYKLMIENEAYKKIMQHPQNAEEINRIQNQYKNKILEYFNQTKSQILLKKLGLNNAFLLMLEKIKVGNSKVGIHLFNPDPKPFKIYKEFLKILSHQ